MCPSPKKVATYDLQPEMKCKGYPGQDHSELEKKEVDLSCLNFANPDMVGHTGILPLP